MGDDMTVQKAALQERIKKVNEQVDSMKATIKEKVEKSAGSSVLSGGGAAVEATKKKMRQRRALKGHFNKVISASWFPDNQHAATASMDGNVIVWDGPSSNKKAMITLKSAWVMTSAISKDNVVATGGLDNVATLWTNPLAAKGGAGGAKITGEFVGHDGYVVGAAFLPSGKFVTVSGDKTAGLWNPAEAHKNKEDQREAVFKGHTADVSSICLQPGSDKAFLTSSADGSILLWDVLNAEKPTGAMRVAFSGDSSSVPDVNKAKFQSNGFGVGAATESHGAKLLDTRACGIVNTYSSKANSVKDLAKYSCAFSSSGRIMFVAGDQGSLEVWDVLSPDSTTPLKRFTDHQQRTSDVSVSADGAGALTTSWDTNAYIYGLAA